MDEIPLETLCILNISLQDSSRVKEPLIIKSVTMIYPVTGWFELMQYNDNKSMKIVNFVETMWLDRYPLPR